MSTDPFIFRCISKLDFFGAPVNFQIRGQKKEQNVIGAIISIGMLSIAIAFSFNSLKNCIQMTNPTITNNIEYGTTNLTFNSSNFFIALSFYTPSKSSVSKSIGASTNDLNAVKYINQLNITCTTCGNDPNSQVISTLMNLCEKDGFTMSLKSMSSSKSAEITSIFSEFSFCLPEELSGVIMDNDDKDSTLASTMQIYIPKNNVSIEYTEVKQNTISNTGAIEIVQTGSSTVASVVNSKTADTTVTSTTSTKTQETQTKNNTLNNPSQNQNSSTPLKLRNLQTISYTELESSNPYLAQDVNTIMSTNFKIYKFPKILIMHKSLEISPSSKPEEIYKTIYNLDVVDYQDPLTGNKLVYDVYIQKYSLSIESGNSFFGYSAIPREFLIVQRIQKNTFDSIDNTGAYLAFKLYSDSIKINVKYVSFLDVIREFGAFYSTLMLLATILSDICNDVFLQRRLITTVFKFVDNQINAVEKYNNCKKELFSEFHLFKEESSKNYSIEGKKVIVGFKMNEAKDAYIKCQNMSEQMIKNIKEIELPHLEGDKSQQANLNSKLKIKESLAIDDQNIIMSSADIREIYNTLKKKQLQVKREYIHVCEYFCLAWACRWLKLMNKRKYQLLRRCSNIIKSFLQIDRLIRKLFEIEYLKQILLTDKQRLLFTYQFQYINFSNYDGSMQFLSKLDRINTTEQIEESDSYVQEERMRTQQTVDEKLIDGLKNYYNF